MYTIRFSTIIIWAKDKHLCIGLYVQHSGSLKHKFVSLQNFTAIVGPNGSGKSNVIDSMLFVFGYRAQKIRSKKISVLIHSSDGHQNVASCSVAVHFQKIIDTGVNNHTHHTIYHIDVQCLGCCSQHIFWEHLKDSAQYQLYTAHVIIQWVWLLNLMIVFLTQWFGLGLIDSIIEYRTNFKCI